MGPPTIPPGASPYAVCLEDITSEIFGHNMRGWEARFLVLICISAITAIMLFVTLISIIEQLLKRNGGSGIWFIKRVAIEGNAGVTAAPISADTHHLIVANTKLILIVFCLAQEIDFIFYLWLGWEAYINNHRWALLYQPTLRAILPFPVVIIGLGVNFGTVQAYVLLTSDKIQQLRLAKITNYAFVWLSVFWTIFFTATVVSSSWAGTRYTLANQALTTWLQDQQESYTGSFSAGAADELQRRYNEYSKDRALYSMLAQSEYGSLPFFAAMGFIVNLSAVLVNRAIRERQMPPPLAHASTLVTANAFGNKDIPLRPLERLRQMHLSLRMPDSLDTKESNIKQPTAHASDSDNCNDERTEQWRTEEHGEQSGIGEGPTLGEMTNFDIDRVRAAQILEINTTKAFLFVMSALIAVATVTCGTVTVFVTIIVRADGPFYHYQWAFEGAMYSYPWTINIFAPPLIFLGMLVQLRARSLWKARRQSRLSIQKSVEVSFVA